jgi:hypothetical protein
LTNCGINRHPVQSKREVYNHKSVVGYILGRINSDRGDCDVDFSYFPSTLPSLLKALLEYPGNKLTGNPKCGIVLIYTL